VLKIDDDFLVLRFFAANLCENYQGFTEETSSCALAPALQAQKNPRSRLFSIILASKKVNRTFGEHRPPLGAGV
jgi:hypothetical protein